MQAITRKQQLDQQLQQCKATWNKMKLQLAELDADIKKTPVPPKKGKGKAKPHPKQKARDEAKVRCNRINEYMCRQATYRQELYRFTMSLQAEADAYADKVLSLMADIAAIP